MDHPTNKLIGGVKSRSYKERGLDFYQAMLKNRQLTYSLHGTPLQPVDHCPRFMIPHATFPTEDRILMSQLRAAIRRVDKDMEIIYDPTTNLPGLPAHHLYTVEKNAYPGGHDKLILEFSLQERIEVEDGCAVVSAWPTGVPKAPGWWVLPILQAIYKGRRDGTVVSTNKAIAQARQGRIDALQAKQDAKDAETSRILYNNVFEPWAVGRIKVGVSGLKSTKPAKDTKKQKSLIVTP